MAILPCSKWVQWVYRKITNEIGRWFSGGRNRTWGLSLIVDDEYVERVVRVNWLVLLLVTEYSYEECIGWFRAFFSNILVVLNQWHSCSRLAHSLHAYLYFRHVECINALRTGEPNFTIDSWLLCFLWSFSTPSSEITVHFQMKLYQYTNIKGKPG